ncbi:3-isopropylmalate dehydratase large subunit [Megasphaera sp. UBA4382]|uniref:3-isopropylmalate dehydratase large subunit n=1 Tax=Megasphaera sp. UBA4382 TaxID=1946850 RepID=UPI0025BFB2C9|nr:aconitase/3-isopropylmalate dehydratase large subunit family protein [Megasphaera sp. UBA4382]
MGHTLAEKILMHNTGVADCRPGDIVITHPDCVMFHDIYTTNVYRKFKEMGFTKSWDPEKVIIMFDHLLPTCLPLDGDHLKYGYQFAEEFGARKVHAGDGICHQLMPELGYARPGDVVFVTDSHTTTYGAVSAFSTGIGYTEMAAVLGTGEMWVRVPSAIKIQIDGTLPDGVCSKDIALRILGDLKAAGGTYKSLEFCGSTIDAMPVDERLTIANMAVECGAKVGLFAPTKESCAYSNVKYDDVSWLHFDDDAEYEKVLTYKAEDMVPYIAAHPYVDNVKPLSELEGMKVDKVFIGSCTNGRLQDLAAAARVLNGRHIAPHIELLITPASRSIFKQAIALGYIQTFIQAGAMVTHPYCSLCEGRSGGLLSDDEVLLGTNNRNFLGRLGSPKSKTYLGSPVVAAATAVAGHLIHPADLK